MKVTSFATVKDGCITIRSLAPLEGKKVEVTIQKLRKRRSSPLNRYWWGVVVELFWRGLLAAGYEVSKEDAHEILKMKFCKVHIMNEQSGEIIEYTRSTSDMTNSEFLDLIAKAQKYAMETVNVYIPDPNEFMQEAVL